MTLKLTRGLALWGALLAAVVLLLLPLSLTLRLVTLAVVAIAFLSVWGHAGRRAALFRENAAFANHESFPSATYRLPVMLVCGDGLSGLFGRDRAKQSMFRLSAQGCYVRVPSIEQLPQTVASVLAIRPDWRAQLSVMFVVNPAENADAAMLAGRIRALGHQLAFSRHYAARLPLFVVAYLQGMHNEGEWFSWEAGQKTPVIRHEGGCVSLSDWQQPVNADGACAHRLQTAVRLKSVAAWLSEVVIPNLAADRGRHRAETPVAFGVCFVSTLSAPVVDNLWQQWLVKKTELSGSPSPSRAAVDALPLPDALLALLPRHTGDTSTRRALVIGIWFLALAGMAALINSGWQNTLLLRQVSDDLRRHAVTVTAAHRDQPEFALREQTLQLLLRDAQRLDEYYRQGEPLGLGFGLYRGERVRRLLWDAIVQYRQPSAEKPQRLPEPVRLDSLSLFSPGSAELKPGSTKVLINALVGIKAQSGWLIVVTGHTDATGNPEHNLQLSRARAAAVRDWMQRMGDIPDSCFAVQGFAASQPLASNDTEQGRAANRRVDIRLVPEEGACALLATASGTQSLSHSATVHE